MTARQIEALRELERHQAMGIPYRWRQTSMRQLAALKMVRRDPARGTDRSPVWVLSAAGRRWLRRGAPCP